MKNLFLFLFCFTAGLSLFSQSNINQTLSINSSGTAADASAMLDMSATDKGMLVPRMTSAQRTAIASPATGLLVFDTDTGGFWFYNGTDWTEIGRAYTAGTGISIAGTTISNAGDTNPADDLTTSSTAGGDLTGTFSNLQIAADVVGAVEIASGAVGTAEIADGTVAVADLAAGVIPPSLPPNGAAGGDLAGTYPNPTVGANAIGSAEITDGSIATADLAADAVTSDKILDATVAAADLAAGVIPTSLPPNGAAGGDLSGTYPNPVLAIGAVNTIEIAANAVTSAKILDGTVAAPDLAPMGATSGQVLSWNGTVWAPATNAPNSLRDADADTKIQVEESLDEDIIRFDLGGAESLVLQKNASGAPRLELTNALSNTFVGEGAGSANTSGDYNTANGTNALYSNTTGNDNTASGSQALYANTTGNDNTAFGKSALYSNTSGNNNTASGYWALYSNTTGNYNAASGYRALYANTEGSSNTASGYFALQANTTGNYNTANGREALRFNTSGNYNAASGMEALYSNTSGSYNTASGREALQANTTGSYNMASGYSALYSNTTGFSNTALGIRSLYRNTTRSNLVAVGDSALYNNGMGTSQAFHATNNTGLGSKSLFSNTSGYYNTASGSSALYSNTTGYSNMASGYNAGDDGIDNINCTAIGASSDVGTSGTGYTNATALGYDANTTADNYARIGNTSVTSIGGQVGWSTYSDGRFKHSVQENVAGLDFITRLRPVTYQWDIHALNDFIPTANDDSTEWASKYDIEKLRFTGFIAQEVEQAASEAGFDFSGVDKPQNETTPYALRYAEFVVPLVKAVQEQQVEIEKIKMLEAENAALKTQLEAQSSALQKITAALENAGIALEK